MVADDEELPVPRSLDAIMADPENHDTVVFLVTLRELAQRYHDVPMELQPLQRRYPPLWYPTHNPESVQYAARHGYNFVGLGPAQAVREHVNLYWETWEAHRHDPGRIFAWGTMPHEQRLRSVRLFADQVMPVFASSSR